MSIYQPAKQHSSACVHDGVPAEIYPLPTQTFHSILEHDVIEGNEFESYYEAKEMLQRYFSHYNRRAAPYHRLHRSIGFVTPQQKWEETQVVYATTFSENLSN